MTIAVVYCRVSTEGQNQEEKTSLDTQKEANLAKARELGYEVPESNILLEVYSGADTDRPQLNHLRTMIRDRSIGAVICYSTDRLARNPIHIGIIAEECEKNKVALVFVTEPLDNSPEGALIRYVKGYAAEIEREKIRERTTRGKKAKFRAGKIASGSHARLYGYNYIRAIEVNGSRREINENEAKWVRQMFEWLLSQGLSTNAICYKLRELNISTPGGAKYWDRSTVYKILRNEAYTGKTYAFTVTYGEAKTHIKQDRKRKLTGAIKKDKSEWIEIPGVTPPIISTEVYEAAQRQLDKNRVVHSTKREYLLHGFLYCGKCNRALWGTTAFYRRNGKESQYRKYRCSGKLRKVSPVRCESSFYQADQLETLVWSEIEAILNDPKKIITEIEKLNRAPEQIKSFETQLADIEKQLKLLDKDQADLLSKSLMGFPDEIVVAENKKINSRRERLQSSQSEIQESINDLKNGLLNLEDMEKFVNLAKSKISSELTCEDKKIALRMLGIRVIVDGDKIEIIGKPIKDILITQSGWHRLLRHLKS